MTSNKPATDAAARAEALAKHIGQRCEYDCCDVAPDDLRWALTEAEARGRQAALAEAAAMVRDMQSRTWPPQINALWSGLADRIEALAAAPADTAGWGAAAIPADAGEGA